MTDTNVLIVEGPRAVADSAAPVRPPYLHWGPCICGAIVAASSFFVLMTFASAIGLAVTSVSPTWRDTSVGLVVLSGAWVVLSAIGSFALGGYIAGQIRATWQIGEDEIHLRDGLHGLLVWGLAIIIGVALAWAAATTIGQTTAKTSLANANATTTEPGFLTFELDRLFRSDRRGEPVDAEARAEAGRIIETGLGRHGLAADDHDYLVRLVSTRTGLAAPDADQRVQRILAESRDAAAKARKGAVIIGFTLAAALVAAAAAAWGAARIGGRHRDQSTAPAMRFSWGR